MLAGLSKPCMLQLVQLKPIQAMVVATGESPLSSGKTPRTKDISYHSLFMYNIVINNITIQNWRLCKDFNIIINYISYYCAVPYKARQAFQRKTAK